MAKGAEKTEIRILPVHLNPDELAAYSYDLARKEREASDLDSQKKALAKDYQGRIDVLREEITSLAQRVETRTEDREVECDLVFYDAAAEVEIVRRDTGEVVTRRPMTPNEKQKALPIDFKPRAAKSGSDEKPAKS